MFAAGIKIIFVCLAPAYLTAAGLIFAATAQNITPLTQAKELEAAGLSGRALDIAVAALKQNPSDKSLYLYTLELLPENAPIGPQSQVTSHKSQVTAPQNPMTGDFRYATAVVPSALTALSAAFKAVTVQALKKNKDYYGYYLGLCKLQRNGGEIIKALSNCRKAMELNAMPYSVYRELGLTWAQAGNKIKAEETLSQGVELFPDNRKAYLNRAAVMEKFGETGAALKDYLRVFDLIKEDKAAGQPTEIFFTNTKIHELSKKTPPQDMPNMRVPQKPAAVSEPLSGQQAVALGATVANAEKCAQDFRSELANGLLETAARTSGECLKLAPSDPDLRKDHAGLLIRLGRYEDAVDEYSRAAELYKKRPMAAFCLVKAAETFMKLGLQADAEEAYRTALKTSPYDLTALNGLAGILEMRGDIKSASGIYEKMLSAEPANARARLRLAEIETGLTLPEQALASLKERQAVDPKKISPASEDLKLFKDITTAERNGAVDYLKVKNHSLKGLILEKQSEKGPRLLLTGAGYRLYLSYLSKDAVIFFEGRPITLRDVFKLRDNAGAPLFNKAGKLTAEGDAALRLAKSGKKSWLLTYEAVPASPQAEKANKEIETALSRGYREISEPEYLWLMKATDCPPEILKNDPVNLLIITDGARLRYLLCYLPAPAVCSNSINDKLPSYIEKYRSGDSDSIPNSDTSTAFFGTGAVKRHRFCENREIWTGG